MAMVEKPRSLPPIPTETVPSTAGGPTLGRDAGPLRPIEVVGGGTAAADVDELEVEGAGGQRRIVLRRAEAGRGRRRGGARTELSGDGRPRGVGVAQGDVGTGDDLRRPGRRGAVRPGGRTRAWPRPRRRTRWSRRPPRRPPRGRRRHVPAGRGCPGGGERPWLANATGAARGTGIVRPVPLGSGPSLGDGALVARRRRRSRGPSRLAHRGGRLPGRGARSPGRSRIRADSGGRRWRNR